jgi:hypothetical protein
MLFSANSIAEYLFQSYCSNILCASNKCGVSEIEYHADELFCEYPVYVTETKVVINKSIKSVLEVNPL